ncbi:MAG: MipA/OmpV family protein [Pseudomonadota bacterium]
MRSPYLYVIQILMFLLADTALADQERNPFSFWYLSDQDPGWYFDATVGVQREPTYTGSDRYETEAGVIARAFYKSESGNRYFVSLGEIGAVVEIDPDTIVAAVLEYEETREIDEDPILAEFPEGENTLEGQFTFVRRWGNWRLGGVFQPDLLDRGKGLVYFLGAGYDRALSDRLRFDAGLDLSWGDAEHINTEVGISDDVAQASGLSPYTASGGFKSTTLTLGLGYAFNPQWELVFNGEVEIYASEMADSPLIEDEGDDVNTEFSIGVRYQF